MPTQHNGRSPENALLGFLYQRANHGYNLHQLMTTELGQIWHTRQSQTYAILKRLEEQGLVTSTVQKQEKLPSKQSFRITTAGRKRFEEWIALPSGSSVHAIRLEFITRLYFASRLFPENVQGMIQAQTAEVEGTLNRLQALRAAIPAGQTFNILGMELRIQQLRSVRRWLTECGTKLDKLP